MAKRPKKKKKKGKAEMRKVHYVLYHEMNLTENNIEDMTVQLTNSLYVCAYFCVWIYAKSCSPKLDNLHIFKYTFLKSTKTNHMPEE